MTNWYDRQGNPLQTFDDDGKPITETLIWFEKKFSDPKYKTVEKTKVGDDYEVSTVWLGINHNFGDGLPLIFETMIFTRDEYEYDNWCWRYTTEAEAKKAHAAIVKALKEHREPKWGEQ
jgi:hypothetical protein